MDIKRKYVDLAIAGINNAYETQKEKIESVANLFGKCIDNNGIIQLFGVRHGEECVNELFFRAGGIAQFHGYKLEDLKLKGWITADYIKSGKAYEDISLIGKFEALYQLDIRDMYCFISYYGNEPLVLEMARVAKEKGQKVVAIINKSAYDKTGSNLLDYCDEFIDMAVEDPDVALDINGNPACQISSTVTNVIAQMLTAQLYRYFVDNGKEAPVLLSMNVKGADVYDASLTDPYGGRIR